MCEGAEPGAVFVDTYRKFDPGFNTHLNGRKYVCSFCIRDLADVVGSFDGERERLQAEVAGAREIARVAEERLFVRDELLETLQKAFAVGVLTKPKPKAKTNPTRMSSSKAAAAAKEIA